MATVWNGEVDYFSLPLFLRQLLDLLLTGQEPSISVAEALLIAREYAPNLAKILVARKWDILEDEVAPLMRCLLLIVDHLVGQMNGDENIHQALECLFNPKQPLYQKLMTLRVPKLPNSSSSSSSFMKTLVEGSCIDCCVNNQWQVGVIERFSDYRTEFEVSLGNGIVIPSTHILSIEQ
eukprot:scaffold1001_cov188-Ochromonas_danica.AAC.17